MSFLNQILPLRRQAEVRDNWLKTRLETLLPELMRREDLDMWIVACREYNEDPGDHVAAAGQLNVGAPANDSGLRAPDQRGRGAANRVALWI